MPSNSIPTNPTSSSDVSRVHGGMSVALAVVGAIASASLALPLAAQGTAGSQGFGYPP